MEALNNQERLNKMEDKVVDDKIAEFMTSIGAGSYLLVPVAEDGAVMEAARMINSDDATDCAMAANDIIYRMITAKSAIATQPVVAVEKTNVH